MRPWVVTVLGLSAAAFAACGSETLAPNDAGVVADGATCIGPTPPASAWSAAPGPVITSPGGDSADAADDAADAVADATDAPDSSDGAAPSSTDPRTKGSAAPLYALRDIQPLSCGFKATYGLPPFKGKVTIAALLAGW